MNAYLKLHKQLMRAYESTHKWPNEEVRKLTHALAGWLYSVSACKPKDKDAIKAYLARAMAGLDNARALHRNGE